MAIMGSRGTGVRPSMRSSASTACAVDGGDGGTTRGVADAPLDAGVGGASREQEANTVTIAVRASNRFTMGSLL
ncbi:MAG: hypothetical protein KF894_23880, partial [Labilithrix sp.]|nr:hypothetical protein [Labilithrix sp.]